MKEIEVSLTSADLDAVTKLFGEATPKEGATIELAPECELVYRSKFERIGAIDSGVMIDAVLSIGSQVTSGVIAALIVSWIQPRLSGDSIKLRMNGEKTEVSEEAIAEIVAAVDEDES